MDELELSTYLRERGASEEDLMHFVNLYLGKTEDEMDAIYDELCGPMA